MRELWTDDDRTVLYLLKRFYPPEHMDRLWNFLRIAQARSRGSSQYKTIGALRSQLAGMSGPGSRGYEIFYRMQRYDDQQIRQKFRIFLRDISMAAKKFNIKEKSDTDRGSNRIHSGMKLSRSTRRKRRARSPSVAETVITEISVAPTEGLDNKVRLELQPFMHNRTVTQSRSENVSINVPLDFRKRLPVHPIGAKHLITRNWNNDEGRQHPLVLFRASETIGSYTARMFQKPGTAIPSPRTFNNAEWQSIVTPHLQDDHAYPSRFISFTDSCERAATRVHRFRSSYIHKKIFLSIFDFNSVQKDAELRFGPETGPYLARDLCSKENLGLPGKYNGSGEWLCYGTVECEPIAVFNGGQTITLVRSLQSLAEGDTAVMDDIDHVLSFVPALWREAVACRFLFKYCANTPYAKRGSNSYEKFMRDIYKREFLFHNELSQSASSASGDLHVSHYFENSNRQPDHKHRAAEEEEEEEEEEESLREAELARGGIVQKTNSPILNLTMSGIPQMQQQPSKDVFLQRSDPVARLNSLSSTPLWDGPIENPGSVVSQGLTAPISSSQLTQSSPLSKFNRGRGGKTPFWSPDSDSEVEEIETEDTNEASIPAFAPVSGLQAEISIPLPSLEPSSIRLMSHNDELTINTDEAEDDWDFVEDDLEQSFATEFPVAAAKARRFDNLYLRTNASSTSNSVVQSVETDNTDYLDSFTQELLATAFAPTPTPVPVDTPRILTQAAPSSITSSSNSVANRPVLLAQSLNRLHQIDLTNDTTENPVRPDRIPDRVRGQQNPIDEDSEIIGSGRRQRVHLPLRSLSVQEVNVICLD